jgi:divalent metal cation (Fe/Co/Zn/Cd) transporter
MTEYEAAGRSCDPGLYSLPVDLARGRLVRRGVGLTYVSLGFNSLEMVVALIAGLAAGSVALLGFGVDSGIELTAGFAALWRLRADHGAGRERVEARSLRLIGACFLQLAAYIAYDAAHALVARERPAASVPGIVLAITSLIGMPVLARAKRRVAVGMRSGALAADARQTALCAYLSAILLGGLLLNAGLGWWWADPLAALIMVPIIAREGVEGLRGRSSCADDCC